MRGLSAADRPLRAAATGWEALTWAALDARLQTGVAAPIGLALSGGGDSLALLLTATAWARERGRRVLALTVDHGLTPDSTAWTLRAGAMAWAAGVDWQPLSWLSDKPSTGLPAAAREARHALIAEAARAAGARVVLVGHTADDVMEADLMRASDAPGLGRVRAWSPSPVWPEGRGVFLLRPTLHVRRGELRAWLAGRRATWLDDPANADPRFARARARLALQGRASIPREGGACDFAQPDDPACGWTATVDGRLLTEGSDLRTETVSAAVLCAAGGTVPPRTDRLARLLTRLGRPPPDGRDQIVERPIGGCSRVSVLAGARVEMHDGVAAFGREAGERARGGLAPVALVAGAPAIWDGRFEVVSDVEGACVAALAGRQERLGAADAAWARRLPPSARPAMPVLLDAAGAARLPRPFGEGAGEARALGPARFAAATGAVTHERDLA